MPLTIAAGQLPANRASQTAIRPAPPGTIHSQRLENGVPLGGIGCGSFQLLTDGAVSRATFNNNWAKPTGDLDGCFAAVWTSAGGRIAARDLRLKSPYGLPAAAGIDYLGVFPQAFVQYPDASLPVSVSLRAYSPLVPQDLMSSTMPVAVFVFTLRNEARAPVDASVALSWENILGVGGTAAKGAFSDRTGNTVSTHPPSDGLFGLHMAGPANPAIDPANRFYYNAQGTYALLAQPTTADTIVTTAGWNALDKTPGWWDRFARDGSVDGSVGPGREGAVHPAGVVALKVSLKAGESRDFPFVFAWHTPRLYTLEGAEYGHFYQKMFDSATAVGRFALENRLALAALTDEWQQRLLRSTAPAPIGQRLLNDAALLVTNSVYTRDSALAGTKPGPALFALLDRPGETSDLGGMERRLYAHVVLAALFPQLDNQELNQFASMQSPAGAIPQLEGSLDQSIATPAASQADRGEASLVGSSASFAYQVAQYYLWSGDPRFLDRFYPVAKHALEFAASRALSLAVASRPAESELALLRGALVAGERLGAAMNDRRFAEQCVNWSRSMPPATDPALSRLSQWMVSGISLDPSGQTAPPTGAQTTLPSAANPAIEAALLTGAGSADSAFALLQAGPRRGIVADDTMTSAASWYVLAALPGPGFDPAAGRLSLTPVLQRGARSFRSPVFAPAYWATMEARTSPNRLQLQFTLDRTLPVAFSSQPAAQDSGRSPAPRLSSPSITVKQVILLAPPNPALQLAASVNRSPITGKLQPYGAGRILFTPDAPVVLTTGQRLEFLFRP